MHTQDDNPPHECLQGDSEIKKNTANTCTGEAATGANCTTGTTSCNTTQVNVATVLDAIRDENWEYSRSTILNFPHLASEDVDPHGRKLIHYACIYEAPILLIDTLLQANPHGPAFRAKMGCLPIFPALRSGPKADLTVVTMLLESPGVQELMVQPNANGTCPLHLGAMHGIPVEVLRAVLKVSPKSALVLNSRDGITPLACYWYRISKSRFGVKAFDSLWAKLLTRDDTVMIPPVQEQYLKDSWEKVVLLLQAGYHGSLLENATSSSTNKADTSSSESNQFRPLHAIAALGCPASMMLLGLYATMSDDEALKVDANGDSALIVALNHCDTALDMPSRGPCDHEVDDDEYYESSDDEEDDSNDHNECSNNDNISLDTLWRNEWKTKTMNEMTTIHALVILQPGIAKIKDRKGQSPLDHAIRSKLDWAKGFKNIIEAAPESISHAHEVTKLYPFMHAAESDALPLVISYCLLKADPDLVKIGIRKTTKRLNNEEKECEGCETKRPRTT